MDEKLKQLLKWLNISTEDSSANITQLLFRLIEKSGNDLPPVEELQTLPQKQQLEILLDILSLEILRIDLSHISPAQLLNKESQSVRYLLDILYEMGLALGLPVRLPKRQSGLNLQETSPSKTSEKRLIDDIPASNPSKLTEFVTNTETVRKSVKFASKESSVVPVEADIDSSDGYHSTLIYKKAKKSIGDLSSFIEKVLPQVEVPEYVKRSVSRKQMERWKTIVENAKREGKQSKICRENDAKFAMKSMTQSSLFESELAQSARIDEQKTLKRKQREAISSIEDVRIRSIRMKKFQEDAESAVRACEMRRKAAEERILKGLLDDANKVEKETYRDFLKMQREDAEKLRKEESIAIESRRKYLQDQKELLLHELKQKKQDEEIREKAKKEFERRLARDEKEKKRKEIKMIRDRLQTDADDFYFRTKDVDISKNDYNKVSF